MTQFLPSNLLALFAARDPIPFLPPVVRLSHERHTNGYTGVGEYLKFFEDPSETPPLKKYETKDERSERKKRERDEQVTYKLEQEIALWNPHAAPEPTDAYKTLFVGRINYDTTESKLKREFESYGPVKKIVLVQNKKTNKPRGYAFVEYEHERDMHSAYKHADGKKIDGKRVLVDVERGRTVKGWLPRRLGGGLGGTRRGGPDVNVKISGREDNADRRGGSYDRDERVDRRGGSGRDRDRRSRSRDRDRDRDRDRGGRDKEKDKHRDRDIREKDKDRKRKRTSRSKSRDRDRDHDKEKEKDLIKDKDREKDKDKDKDRISRRRREKNGEESGDNQARKRSKSREKKRKRSKSRDKDKKKEKKDKDRTRDKDRSGKDRRDKDGDKIKNEEIKIQIKEEPQDEFSTFDPYNNNDEGYDGYIKQENDDNEETRPSASNDGYENEDYPEY